VEDGLNWGRVERAAERVLGDWVERWLSRIASPDDV
jgi:hypothetical protein